MSTSAEHAALHDILLEEQGPLCLIPDCTQQWSEKAHIWPSGLGGRPSMFRASNLVGLCPLHHAIYDGHRLEGRQNLLRTLMQHLKETCSFQPSEL